MHALEQRALCSGGGLWHGSISSMVAPGQRAHQPPASLVAVEPGHSHGVAQVVRLGKAPGVEFSALSRGQSRCRQGVRVEPVTHARARHKAGAARLSACPPLILLLQPCQPRPPCRARRQTGRTPASSRSGMRKFDAELWPPVQAHIGSHALENCRSLQPCQSRLPDHPHLQRLLVGLLVQQEHCGVGGVR